MAYTKQTWANGDTITAAKMNHIEDGIAEMPPGFDVLIVYEASSPSYATVYGDYATTVAKMQNHLPVIGCHMHLVYDNAENPSFISYNMFSLFVNIYYDEPNDRIILRLDSVQGWYWTENGVTYFA